MTSPTSTPSSSVQKAPKRPDDASAAALYDAAATEFGTIYGYGIVSAHTTSDVNDLVSSALRSHREQREALLELLAARSINAPLPAAGYQLPIPVNTPQDGATLAVRMETDTATAWRAVLEQAPTGSSGDAERKLALAGLTTSAVLAARWRRVLGLWPITTAFPGGTAQ